VGWRAHANLLYANWLNYFVYQVTPYRPEEISSGATRDDFYTKTWQARRPALFFCIENYSVFR